MTTTTTTTTTANRLQSLQQRLQSQTHSQFMQYNDENQVPAHTQQKSTLTSSGGHSTHANVLKPASTSLPMAMTQNSLNALSQSSILKGTTVNPNTNSNVPTKGLNTQHTNTLPSTSNGLRVLHEMKNMKQAAATSSMTGTGNGAAQRTMRAPLMDIQSATIPPQHAADASAPSTRTQMNSNGAVANTTSSGSSSSSLASRLSALRTGSLENTIAAHQPQSLLKRSQLPIRTSNSTVPNSSSGSSSSSQSISNIPPASSASGTSSRLLNAAINKSKILQNTASSSTLAATLNRLTSRYQTSSTTSTSTTKPTEIKNGIRPTNREEIKPVPTSTMDNTRLIRHEVRESQAPKPQAATGASNVLAARSSNETQENLEDRKRIRVNAENIPLSSNTMEVCGDVPPAQRIASVVTKETANGATANPAITKSAECTRLDMTCLSISKSFNLQNVDCGIREYVADIMSHLRAVELKHAPLATYLSLQPDINYRMREILIDWLHEVHAKFELHTETLYLCISIIDRFLSIRAINRGKLQLLGCASMLLACKYEEILVPEVNDFVIISDHAYTREQMLGMESLILNTLKFSLTAPSPARFLDAYLLEAMEILVESPTPSNSPMRDENTNPKHTLKVHHRICQCSHYLLRLTLQFHTFLTYSPSTLAAAALYHALKILNLNWTDEISRITHKDLSSASLKDCIHEMFDAWSSFQDRKYNAVFRIFSDEEKYNNVSQWTKLVQPTI